MEKQNKKSIPIRIRMISERYEVAASLFDSVIRSSAGLYGMHLPSEEPMHVSQEDELLMGIMEDEESDGGYFVKPADPANMNAARGMVGSHDDGVERLELYSEGLMTCVPSEDGIDEQISITYDETELTGMEGAHSTVTFRTGDPAFVHLIRSGTVTTALTFKPHHRAICVYETPYMPFQVGIHCLTVDNRLLEDGVLRLDYIIEIRGAKAERCRMDMQIL